MQVVCFQHFRVCLFFVVFSCFKADEVDRKNVFKVHHKNVRVYLFQAQNEDSVDRYIIGSAVNEIFQVRVSLQSC